MNLKICYQRGIKIVLFMALFIVMANHFNNILRDKSEANGCATFYTEKFEYDVLFFGNSTTYNGISPLDLWHDYGITSFNLANQGQGLDANYYAMEDALKRKHPKLVVVDLSYINHSTSDERLHSLLDNMPWGSAKIEAIFDLTKGTNIVNFAFPLVFYHSNWVDVNKSSYKEITSINKGATVAQYSKGSDGEIFDTSIFSEELNIIDSNEKLDTPQYQLEYIKKMIQLCKKKNIQILFVNYPSYATGKTNHGDGETLQKYWNGFADVAEQYDVDYINGLQLVDDIGFDFVTDLRDWRHLSVYGNIKMTSYLGEYIQKNYGITDHRGEEAFTAWDEDYEKWDQYRWEQVE